MTETNTFIDLSKFEKVDKIGSGKFGLVYTIKEKETGIIYAAKITKDPLNSENESLLLNLRREVNLLSQLNHPAILKFIGYSPKDFNSNNNPVIITEYSKFGSLSSVLQLEKEYSSPDLWDDTQKLINIYGIASAMSYLHSNDIIHRDLKPDNILESDTLCPLLADFGLSKISPSENYKTVQSMIGIKGTPFYIPPEAYTNGENSKEGDVYAFSMIVYEMMTCEKPFSNFEKGYFDFMEMVNNGGRPDFNVEIAERYKKLITDCWSQNPSERPTFSEIVTQLKEDESFITPSIDEERFHNYINLIENAECSFNPQSRFQHDIFDAESLDTGERITLRVRIYEAKNLLKMNFSEADSPFITLNLKSKPDKSKMRTKKQANTLNPVWNEDFYYIGAKSNDKLCINMFDDDLKVRCKMMNEMQVPISSSIVKKGYDIEYKFYKNAGRLFFSLLTSLTKHGYLKIHVFDAKNLIKTGFLPFGKPSPSISFKIQNLPNFQAKTSVKENETDPVWNQDFIIEVPDINYNALLVDLLDGDRVVNERKVTLSNVPISKIQIFNSKIFDKSKVIGTLHYGFELCAGYPKQSNEENKMYLYHC